MNKRKFVHIIFSLLIMASFVLAGLNQASAMPANPTDSSKVPHYFGPWPNYANSAFTVPDVAVDIVGDGAGAAATASVGGDGAVTAITVTDPGVGYTFANVNITGGGSGATASATVVTSGVLAGVTVDTPGSSYTAPVVTITGGGATLDATAIAYGSVDAIFLGDSGDGYTFPTVDFDMPDDPDGVMARAHAEMDALTGTITNIVIDNPGSGYSAAPNVVIRDGTIFDPIAHPGAIATASATIDVQSIGLTGFGVGYTSAPSVSISDALGIGAGATATAAVDFGGVTGITVLTPGTGYITTGGIKKFQDGLPVLCDPTLGWANCTDNNLGQHLPIAVPDTTTFTIANGFPADADYYVIALVQHREQMSSSLPAQGTLLREYVQLETPYNFPWSKHVELQTDLRDGTSVPTLMPDGSQAVAVDDPHYLGPAIIATKDKPVRIVFYNLLPTGSDGDLFIPVDSTFMGSGMGPMMMMDPMDQGTVMDMVRNPACGEPGKDLMSCFAENRMSIHLHGGITPWISDGSPHQWITPANEMTSWPEGVSVSEVPDMTGAAAAAAGIPDCAANSDGCTTFYYTNQQSARLMFYHDHAWGITRLNVYAGEAAAYLITDDTEKKLIADGVIPADQIPLVIQEKTFLPSPAAVAQEDPTWDYSRWGSEGDLWYEHVYMPAQNPNDPGGMSAYGRWMYGPWFWPPAIDTVHGPIANPYFDPSCNLDDPATWQYDTDPFCEPPLIPGTPNNSAGMEQFNDTPTVNGTAYPTTTVDPKAYRLRILNAANDRFWNLQWYVGDPTTASTGLNQMGEVTGPTEVALNAAELAAAQTDLNIIPGPDTAISPPGPSWIQIGTEGGFLPAPVVVPNQPITYITDPTRFDVGNVDKHSLLVAPAERADVIVDFSRFAGQTLILYNDAPAAFPARVPSYDYYTGAPDMSPNAAAAILPGYGPNTRTIMQVKVRNIPAAPAFNLTKLQAAFRHHADGSGVFESGQHPIIVGQGVYNSAYGTSFAYGGWCNSANNPSAKCDGFARINEQGGDMFKFDTLLGNQISVKIEPKAIHDEMNAMSFDEFGRMSGNLGVEAVPATPGLQNVILYPFVNPPTELIDATNLPTGMSVTPIAAGDDGTQIWKFTHNGVDTHPIHFHLYDVQLLNRVTWDNIILPPDPEERGWKDTVRVSPLEDTYFAIRPIIPELPFEIPNNVRPLNPMMPAGSTAMFNPIDIQGNPTNPVINQLVNFGWEYMIHCHILSHEEMDMMRPVTVAMPPNKADGLVAEIISLVSGSGTLRLTFNDNSISETSYLIQRSDAGGPWVDLGSIDSPLDQPNTKGVLSFDDTTYQAQHLYQYQVVALNTIGLGGQFPSMTVQSVSDPVAAPTAPPTGLVATGLFAPAPVAPAGPLAPSALNVPQVQLDWTDNAADETGFVVERADNGGAFAQIASLPANTVTYLDLAVAIGNTYDYRVYAVNGLLVSAFSNVATIGIPTAPADPTNLIVTGVFGPQAQLDWTDNAVDETDYVVERSDNGGAFAQIASLPANTITYLDATVLPGNTYDYRVYALGGFIPSGYSNIASLFVPPVPGTPGDVSVTVIGSLTMGPRAQFVFNDTATNETGFIIERADNGGAFVQLVGLGPRAGTGNMVYPDYTILAGNTYDYRVRAVNGITPSPYSSAVTAIVPPAPAAPSNFALSTRVTNGNASASVDMTWVDNSTNEDRFVIQRADDAAFTVNLFTLTPTANVTALTQSGLPFNTTYYYRIAAQNGFGYSAWVNAVPFPIVTSPPPVLPAPTNLTATVIGSLTMGPRVQLVFRDNAVDETGFVVERSDNGGTFAQIATLPARGGTGNVVYADYTILASNTYDYRVYAVRVATLSAYSNTANAVIPAAPAAPSNFNGVTSIMGGGASARIALTWTDNSNNESRFVIQRATDAAFTTGLTTVNRAANSTNLTQNGLARGATYYYRIMAQNAYGQSVWVNLATFPIVTP